MSEPLPARVVGDLSGLPDSATGPRHLVWWGNLCFMLIEGTGFALAAGAYLYLQSQSPVWPTPGNGMPGLLWSSIFTVCLLLSQIPNLIVKHSATAKRERPVQIGTIVMTLAGLALCVLRGFELAHLNAPWHLSAYGSVVWLLMVLHTSHLVTDLADTAVQALTFNIYGLGDDQFADAEDNCNYWSFVVLAWLPIWGLVYWAPRLG